VSEQEDKAIWAAYAKGVKRRGDDTSTAPNPPPPTVLEVQEKDIVPSLPTPPVPPPQPLDVRIERNMSLGDVVIEARLDLHGRTEQEAYDDFRAFVEAQSARGKRMLLVITGKSGTLRTNLPRWSQTPVFAPYIQAVREASLIHGGEGAYYVLLHKRP